MSADTAHPGTPAEPAATHTPGPWQAEARPDENDFLDPKQSVWISGRGWGSFAHVASACGGDDADGEGAANVALILAAPDLLAVARKWISAVGILHDGPDDSDKELAHRLIAEAYTEGKAAIAKAEGRAL